MNKYQSSGQSSRQPIKQSIELKHKTSDCRKLHNFLLSHIKTNDMPDDIPDEMQHDLRLVIEEIFCNIVNHADVASQNNAITVELSYSIHTIIITFTDTGIAFNPLCDHENCMHSNDHAEGGMGVHLIKSLTDHQEYKRIDQQNVFTVTKHYNK